MVRYVQGLLDQGISNLRIDDKLIQDCAGNINALIPIAVYSRLHRDILRVRSFEALISMRDRIWLDVQVKYSLTKFIRYNT
jgi:hypothetical protein